MANDEVQQQEQQHQPRSKQFRKTVAVICLTAPQSKTAWENENFKVLEYAWNKEIDEEDQDKGCLWKQQLSEQMPVLNKEDLNEQESQGETPLQRKDNALEAIGHKCFDAAEHSRFWDLT
jgi:hypothetical protein